MLASIFKEASVERKPCKSYHQIGSIRAKLTRMKLVSLLDIRRFSNSFGLTKCLTGAAEVAHDL